ncbi:phytoene desaturase family protein [Aquirufa nivalisilvae]|uniref:phytoene desaturase family protein n=1 Tax=Aquirufa nivalisilvae TaxID=2516557 RepID=UPI001032AE4B|nr:NAD(P)/FAD-dependent oxidoreductase [Aquirufa nivalisilvae]TBH76247.1 NAD(P)/FAD-dependent oxidoreductase [Aquirufa nivalisilvae]
MKNRSTEYDAIVVGSGPNGLASAIYLQQKGLSVLMVEAKDSIGGGLRTEEITLPGFKHDICSAIHPLAAASPFFKTLPLQDHGLTFIQPIYSAAHPLANGDSAVLAPSLELTAHKLGYDGENYRDLIQPFISHWESLLADILAPLHVPNQPINLAKFGLKAMQPASWLVEKFETEKAKALWAGMAAHSIQPLQNWATSAIGLVLMTAAHKEGWLIPKGGSSNIAKALSSYFLSLGGKIETNFYVKSLNQLPSAKAILFDLTPRQILGIAGHRFSSIYRWQLEKYRYGMGVFKIDWAIEGQVPFESKEARLAGTVHLGNTWSEITQSELDTSKGKQVEQPFVLLAQQSLFDRSRAPEGKNAVWAYCHVPHGSTKDMTEIIEKQVERFAPGFRERILAKHSFNTAQLESYNANYIGGDINGGIIDLAQLFTRPALRSSPYRTSTKGLYICSSSSPPGGGVHGMCGYHAAERAYKDLFINA